MTWGEQVLAWIRETYANRSRLALGWRATPLPLWLQRWGIVQTSFFLLLALGIIVYVLILFAPSDSETGPAVPYLYIFLTALPLGLLLVTQLLFFIRSSRKGALLTSSIMLLLSLMIGESLAILVNLALLMTLWWTGGVRDEVKPNSTG